MRRAWRVMSGLALILAAASCLLSVVLYSKIQQERENNIRTSCLSVNERHDNTIFRLDRLIVRMPEGPRKKRAEANRKSTVFLLEAIVPHRDCEAYVRQQVHHP